jgi:hypothetical protein
MEFITIPEAAKRTGKVPATIYLAIRNGELEAEYKYGILLISEQAIKNYNPRPRGRPRGLASRNTNLRTDISQSELARQLGVSRQCIHQILNREARNARSLVAAALKSGNLVKSKTCERCEKRKRNLQGHHPDYSKPLNVQWLCPPCHSLIHPHHNNVHGRKPNNGKSELDRIEGKGK